VRAVTVLVIRYGSPYIFILVENFFDFYGYNRAARKTHLIGCAWGVAALHSFALRMLFTSHFLFLF
jgi:hypothetical protein